MNCSQLIKLPHFYKENLLTGYSPKTRILQFLRFHKNCGVLTRIFKVIHSLAHIRLPVVNNFPNQIDGLRPSRHYLANAVQHSEFMVEIYSKIEAGIFWALVCLCVFFAGYLFYCEVRKRKQRKRHHRHRLRREREAQEFLAEVQNGSGRNRSSHAAALSKHTVRGTS